MKSVALIPVYNEERHITNVLDKIRPLVDEIIIINDDSDDRSRQLITGWLRNHPPGICLSLEKHSGMSAAMKEGYRLLRQRLTRGDLDAQDIVVRIDADEQHEPQESVRMREDLIQRGLDLLKGKRDLSGYPAMKLWGNRLMSLLITWMSGVRQYDSESGFFVARLGPLLEGARWCQGKRFSMVDEISVALPRLGYRIANDFKIRVPYYQSHTKLRDVFINLWLSFKTLIRIKTGKKPKEKAIPAQEEAFNKPGLAA